MKDWWDGWGIKEWGYFIFTGLIIIGVYSFLYFQFGIQKEWAMVIILTPLLIIGYFINKKKK